MKSDRLWTLQERLRRRNVHVRQYMDGRTMEMFYDGKFQYWGTAKWLEEKLRDDFQIDDEEWAALKKEMKG